MRNRGLLLVISGPAGSGKGTVLKELMDSSEGYAYSVSATTRPPRPGETDGVHYHFMQRDEFEKRASAGEFLEYAEYIGNYYGTLLSEVEGRLDEGTNVILEIEIVGAEQVKRKIPDAVMIFIAPPDIATLESRLRGRGTEADEIIGMRMAQAVRETEGSRNYDYIIVNRENGVTQAAEDIKAVVRAEGLRTSKNPEFISKFLNN